MPTSESRPSGEATDHRAAHEATLSVGQLAHELNSLLDGSMRSIRLAEAALNDRSSDRSRDEIVRRLQTAQQAMGDIAVMLERAMSRGLSGVDMLRVDRSLGDEAEFVAAALASMAERAGVTVRASIAPDAARLPAGALGALLMNVLRNAIEAAAGGRETNRAVDFSIALPGDDELHIEVTDTGPGPHAAGTREADDAPTGPPAVSGHGLGLVVCRAIVADLGGTIELRRGPRGGAVFETRLPLRSIRP